MNKLFFALSLLPMLTAGLAFAKATSPKGEARFSNLGQSFAREFEIVRRQGGIR